MLNSVGTETEVCHAKPEVLSRGLVQQKANRALFDTSQTLKQITQRCVLAHKDLYCNFANLHEKIDTFSTISKDMKNELLEVMAVSMKPDDGEKEVELQCHMLRLLTNSETSSFCFPPALGPGNQTAASQLWHSLVDNEQPLNLRTLTIQRLEENHQIWDVRPFLTRLLPKFLNLETLQLGNFECQDADLCLVAQRLPQLRVLEVVLSEQVSRRGIAALSRLRYLQEFLFPLFRENNYYENRWLRGADLLELCFELLPHLHVVAYKLTTFWSGRPLNALSTLTKRVLTRVTIPLTLQLRYLALDTIIDPPKRISLLQVRVLYLINSSFIRGPLAPDRFPNLTELYMHDAYVNTLMEVVGHGVGRKLQVLKLNVYGRIKCLDRLLEACPVLCELFISASSNPLSESPLRPDTLQNLHTLNISCPNSDRMQSGLMIEFFRLAPNLRSVELIIVPMAEEYLQELTEMVKQGTCLRKLESFKFYRKIFVPFISARENQIRDEAIMACGTYLELLNEFVFSDCYLPGA